MFREKSKKLHAWAPIDGAKQPRQQQQRREREQQARQHDTRPKPELKIGSCSKYEARRLVHFARVTPIQP